MKLDYVNDQIVEAKHNVNFYEKDNVQSGTSLQGYITAAFTDLYDLFGKPNYADPDPYNKVNCEWCLVVKDFEGNYHDCTIYNWKTGTIPYDEYEWHIGGRSIYAASLVQEIIDRQIKPL